LFRCEDDRLLLAIDSDLPLKHLFIWLILYQLVVVIVATCSTFWLVLTSHGWLIWEVLFPYDFIISTFLILFYSTLPGLNLICC
jgi:hypothetical protein